MTTGEATANEILDFLHENMVTKEEFKVGLDETKTELRGEMNKMKTELRSDMNSMKAELRGDMNNMKLDIIDHVDDKLADLEGTVIVRQRKQDNKVNKILELLERHRLAPAEEIHAIRNIQIFPAPPPVS